MIKNRDDLQDKMSQFTVDSLDIKDLIQFAYDDTYNSLDKMSNVEFLETITEFYPDLKDSVEMEDGK